MFTVWAIWHSAAATAAAATSTTHTTDADRHNSVVRNCTTRNHYIQRLPVLESKNTAMSVVYYRCIPIRTKFHKHFSCTYFTTINDLSAIYRLPELATNGDSAKNNPFSKLIFVCSQTSLCIIIRTSHRISAKLWFIKWFWINIIF